MAMHALYPAGQPRAHTTVLALGRAPFLCISELRSCSEPNPELETEPKAEPEPEPEPEPELEPEPG